jgi:site-specific recombinase
VNEQLEQARTLRHILTRLGVRQAASYWANPLRVFISNFWGGAVAGVAASVVAAIILGIDLHRGQNSVSYEVLRDTQTIIATIEEQIHEELH